MITTEKKCTFKTFLKISAVPYKNSKEMRNALVRSNYNISITADSVLDNISSSEYLQQREETQLVIIAASDIGITGNYHFIELCKQAKEEGLDLCSPVTGPSMRLQIKKEKMDSCLYLAMKTVMDNNFQPHVFCVAHDELLQHCLDATNVKYRTFHKSVKWIFTT